MPPPRSTLSTSSASRTRPPIPPEDPSTSSRLSTSSRTVTPRTSTTQRSTSSRKPLAPASREDDVALTTDPAAASAQHEEDPEALSTEQLLPTFEPLFTLVEDNHSSSIQHPSVFYIFNDDDGEVLNDTVLRLSSRQEEANETDESPERKDQGQRKERYVVVNLAEDGKSVKSAHSLTGDWQVISAEVSLAPMLEGGEDETGGLMLRVVGTEGLKLEDQGLDGDFDVEAAIERFRERMEELKRVVEASSIDEEEDPSIT